MIAASRFCNLNKITKADFGYLILNMQTTRKHKSNILFMPWQFSKRFLVQCKNTCLKLFLISLLWWLFLDFSVSPGIPSHLAATMPPLLCFPATSIPVQFPSQIAPRLRAWNSHRGLPWQCALLGKADPQSSCQMRAVQKSQDNMCSFQIQLGKKCWKGNLNLSPLCNSCESLPLIVILTDFIAGQGKVLGFYGGL